MGSLYLLRHAKSSWDDPAVNDHDRRLSERGRTAAALIADHLRGRRLHIDLVLCSPSVRTRQTLDALAGALGEPEVVIDEGIYENSTETLLNILRSIDDDVESALVIGHNPSMQELALALDGGDSPKRERLQTKFPTASLAIFEVPDPWHDLHSGAAHLIEFIRPKDLAS